MKINTRAMREFRRTKGWTLTTLSAVSGIPQPNLSRIEKGDEQVSWTKLEALAKAFGFNDPAVLVGPDGHIDEETWPHRRGGNRRTKAVA